MVFCIKDIQDLKGKVLFKLSTQNFTSPLKAVYFTDTISELCILPSAAHTMSRDDTWVQKPEITLCISPRKYIAAVVAKLVKKPAFTAHKI